MDKIINPHQMLLGTQYKITEPNYDDDETSSPYIVEVISKLKHSFILKNIEHNFTFERTFQHLITCDINKII